MNAIEKLENYIKAERQFSNCYEIILQILVIYNCRISEILKATHDNFNPDKFLCLHGAKGSAAVIIRDREILRAISKLPKNHPTLIFPFVTYYQVYHFIKTKYSHLLTGIKIKKNMKVTHAFRYSNVDKLKDENIIREVLHHRSMKSSKFYINKMKNSN